MNTPSYRKKVTCPPVVGARVEPDVKLLLERAANDGFGCGWSDTVNRALRKALTPLYGNKQISNLQQSLGVDTK